MPARDQQQQIGKLDFIGQANRQRVGLEMVDREKRLAGGPGEALGHHRADDQTADQARARRSSYPVDLGERDAGFGERAR